MFENMAKWLRLIGLFFIIGPFSAMFAEPFFEAVFDKLGWDTEDLAGPLVTAMFELFAESWFRYSSVAAIGMGTGVWLHWLATRFDRRRSQQSASAHNPALESGVAPRPETRLRLRVDGTGNAAQEINQNINWQQTVLSMEGQKDGADNVAMRLVRQDTISIAFGSPIEYERPIVETFGHTVKQVGSYPLGKNGYVLVFMDGLPPVIDITFPPPGYYEQKSIENIKKDGSAIPQLPPSTGA